MLFPRNREEASYQTMLCAAAMRSTRTREPAHELLPNFLDGDHGESGDKVCYTRYHPQLCEGCGNLEQHECAEKLLQTAKKMKHWGVFEHAYFTVSVSGVSRALTHQLVRHRLFSYLQQSQRSVEIDTEKGDWYVVPKDLQEKYSNDTVTIQDFHSLMTRISQYYKHLDKCAINAEDARFILPNATKTHIVITGNARNWLHFFKLRLDAHAQWEIREMAKKILEEFMKYAPIIFDGAGELEV